MQFECKSNILVGSQRRIFLVAFLGEKKTKSVVGLVGAPREID